MNSPHTCQDRSISVIISDPGSTCSLMIGMSEAAWTFGTHFSVDPASLAVEQPGHDGFRQVSHLGVTPLSPALAPRHAHLGRVRADEGLIRFDLTGQFH